METVTAFKTTDGRLFEDAREAERHEREPGVDELTVEIYTFLGIDVEPKTLSVSWDDDEKGLA